MTTKVKSGQVWFHKDTGRPLKITGKATGNGHWSTDSGHHIHEGTLRKFFRLKGQEMAER